MHSTKQILSLSLSLYLSLCARSKRTRTRWTLPHKMQRLLLRYYGYRMSFWYLWRFYVSSLSLSLSFSLAPFCLAPSRPLSVILPDRYFRSSVIFQNFRIRLDGEMIESWTVVIQLAINFMEKYREKENWKKDRASKEKKYRWISRRTSRFFEKGETDSLTSVLPTSKTHSRLPLVL